MSRRALALLAVVAAAAMIGIGAFAGGSIGRAPSETASVTPAPPLREGRVFLSAADARRGAAEGLLPVGVSSVLDVRHKLRHGEYEWNDDGVPAGDLAIRVDVDRQLISVFRAGHEIGTAVVLYGADGKATPIGRFPIKGKSADYHSRTYDAPMPFSLWLTDDGVAVHGSRVRDGRATNGCVGVPIEFARRLFDEAEIGDVVEVVSSRKATPA